ncbi:hypothetical protein [Nocardia macrotermitis]|uniref:CDP-Glycerol:Poly(Glycerophosphate) glycerophosphotransferase n=1 Tax=Nocardia macrotermitis TaxID=2585198 RepID=A0A7K0CYL2_9NOCA|nr:hypothetical protein [Nocardia macrotermitis]MQY18541.1 hypothetical protein [Nocardia macrotermitis]
MIPGPGVPLEERLRDWLTVPFDKRVLVVARTVTALNRLLDIVSLIQTDRRVQIVFTTDPAGRAVFRRGVNEMLTAMEVAVVTWEHATAVEFHLIVAASENDRLHLLRGPKLLVAHGFGHQKYYPNGQVVAGMNPARLLRDGRLIPTVIGISHPAQKAELAITCPPAAEHATVIGDPALDRMLASHHHGPAYRRAFGASGRTVVLLASTWGKDSLFRRWPELPEATATALSVDRHRLLLVLHPGVRATHSQWQVEAWLTRAREAGLVLVDQRHWQAALVASDAVIADQSSLALYAAALRKPLLLTPGEAEHTVVGSPLDQLAASTDRLQPHEPLGPQIAALAATEPPADRAKIIAAGVSEVSSSAKVLRDTLHELLNLAARAPDANYPPAPKPAPQPISWTTLVASATEHDGALRIHRVPALRYGIPFDDNDFRHLIADLDTASIAEVSAARIIVCTDTDEREFAATAPALLTEWSHARLVVMRNSLGECVVHHAEGRVIASAQEPPIGFDPTVLASMVYIRLLRRQPPTGTGRLTLGDHTFTVRVVAG